LDTVVKKIGKSEWWMVVIGWVVEVGKKNEWWRVVIGWEENVGGEVVIFWDKSWELKVVIFWDGGSICFSNPKLQVFFCFCLFVPLFFFNQTQYKPILAMAGDRSQTTMFCFVKPN
jgi:hypothetical protein